MDQQTPEPQFLQLILMNPLFLISESPNCWISFRAEWNIPDLTLTMLLLSSNVASLNSPHIHMETLFVS